MESIPYSVVRFASIECKMQMSGELSVLHMVDAWRYANDMAARIPVVDDVLKLGRLIEPHVNLNGFRKYGVRVGSDIMPNWENVPLQMIHLMDDVQHSMDPVAATLEFLKIHPFGDGNGRTSAIMYLWLTNKLNDPEWPPNFFNDPRRTVGYGA